MKLGFSFDFPSCFFLLFNFDRICVGWPWLRWLGTERLGGAGSLLKGWSILKSSLTWSPISGA